MAKIAFILLTHKDPKGIVAQAQRLTATGDFVAIHFDARANPEDFALVRAALADNRRVTFAARRHRCGWGEWSLVAATLEAVRAAVRAFPAASHFYMLSGDCMPIKSAAYTHGYLDNEDADFIESFDFFDSDWIRTGFRGERLHYRHWFNERSQKRLFYLSYEIQRRLRLTRPVPEGIRVMIGSQWWCLRRETIEKILAFCDARRDVVRFFRTTWIPDETFFQTLVAHLVPRTQIRRRPLTFLIFTDYGMPVTFHNDHYDMLVGQDFLFARKISPHALELRQRLGELWADGERSFPVSGSGKALYGFLAGQGRIGRRFGRRFWEREAGFGRGRTLLMIVAKKWHAAKRLSAAIRAQTAIPAVDYLFNEMEAGLPDLGGVETTLAKRERHRRALVRLLFDEFGSNRLAICLDPHALGLITDFARDKADVRLLFIEPNFDDDYLVGHIRRVGLAGPDTPDDVLRRLVPAVRADLEMEGERLRDLDLPRFYTLDSRAEAEANLQAVARFLGVSSETAQRVLATPHLLDD